MDHSNVNIHSAALRAEVHLVIFVFDTDTGMLK